MALESNNKTAQVPFSSLMPDARHNGDGAPVSRATELWHVQSVHEADTDLVFLLGWKQTVKSKDVL